jgi:hypothetical protein
MDSAYAGKYCEHIATVFCDHNKDDSSFGSSTSYCTNGAKCKEKATSDQK